MSVAEEIADLGRELATAAAFLTRLPVHRLPFGWDRSGDLAAAARAFPVIGAVLGAAAGAVYWIAALLGVPDLAAAFLAIAGAALLTGGLHEDGLADVADGFGGGDGPEAKLAIMRDSRIGAYGVLTLIVVIGMRAAALAAIANAAGGGASGGATVMACLIAAGAASRGVLPVVMASMELARSDGLAAGAGQPQGGEAAIAALLGGLIAVLFLGPVAGIAALIVVAVAVGILAWAAHKQIGGVTGDVLGAMQQVAETTLLLAAAASL